MYNNAACLGLAIFIVFAQTRGLVAAGKSNAESQSNAIQALLDSSISYCNQGHFVEAEANARRGLKLVQTGHQSTAQCLLQLAHVLELEGKYAESQTLTKQALAIHTKYGEREMVAADNILLADLFRQQGQYRQAKPLLENVVQVLEGKKNYARQSATAVNNLGALYYWLGDDSRAVELLERAAQMRQKIYGRSHPSVANSLADLAVVYIRLGRKDEGKALLAKALSMRNHYYGPHPETATTLGNLGAFYLDLGNVIQAQRYYQQACRIMERWPTHPDRANYLVGLAAVFAKDGRFPQADELCQKGLAIQSKILSQDSPLIAKTLTVFGNCKVDEGKFVEASKLLERALSIQERSLGACHPAIAQTLEGLGDCYYLDGQILHAEKMYQRALNIRQQVQFGDKLPLALVCNNLGNCCLEQGKLTDAAALYKQSLALMQSQISATGDARVKTIEDNYRRCLLKLKQ